MTLVSDGCLCHVSLRVPASDIIGSHDGHVYRLLERIAAGQMDCIDKQLAAEIALESARGRVSDLVRIGMRTLLSMGTDPLVGPGDHLELRLLLCRVEPPLAQKQ